MHTLKQSVVTFEVFILYQCHAVIRITMTCRDSPYNESMRPKHAVKNKLKHENQANSLQMVHNF